MEGVNPVAVMTAGMEKALPMTYSMKTTFPVCRSLERGHGAALHRINLVQAPVQPLSATWTCLSLTCIKRHRAERGDEGRQKHKGASMGSYRSSSSSIISQAVQGTLGEKKAVPSPSPLGVVITGGTKGLGFAMAREFLAAGDKVLICGRSQDRCDAAAEALLSTVDHRMWADGAGLHAVQCDVTDARDVAALGAAAQERLGAVHLWLNNAGCVTAKKLLPDLSPEEIVDAASTNVLGSLLGCREAIRIMREQPGALEGGGSGSNPALYHIFNMGFSRWGAAFSRTACTHKSTKTALTALTTALVNDLKEAGILGIGVHNLSPGMALTDLLLQGTSPAARRFFNALAEEPTTVAAEVVPRVRAVHGTGTSIDFLSPPVALVKVLTGLPQIINGGRFFDKEGNRVAVPGRSFSPTGVEILYDQMVGSKATR